MRKRNVLRLALLLSAVWLTACASLSGYKEQPRVSLAGINVLDVGLFEQRFALRLRVQNPNDIELPIKGWTYDLDLNGIAFATGTSNKTATIPAFGTDVIEVEAYSDITNVLRQISEWRKSGLNNVSYRLKGNAFLASTSRKLAFDYRGDIALPTEEKKQ